MVGHLHRYFNHLIHENLSFFVFASTLNHEFMEVELGENDIDRGIWEIIYESDSRNPTSQGG